MGSAILPRWGHQAGLWYLAAGWRDTTALTFIIQLRGQNFTMSCSFVHSGNGHREHESKHPQEGGKNHICGDAGIAGNVSPRSPPVCPPGGGAWPGVWPGEPPAIPATPAIIRSSRSYSVPRLRRHTAPVLVL